MDPIRSDQVIEHNLVKLNEDLSQQCSSDVLILKAPMTLGVDDVVRLEIEWMKESKKVSSDRLTVLIETNGGYIEVVERIVSVFRKHYKLVDFIVPNCAYSAGTVLVMSGDEIYMDYYSVLGPIDPQYDSDGQFVPGMGYLAKYEELMGEINGCDPAKLHQVQGQVAYLVRKFDPAKLFHIEQAIEHSKSLLRTWLPKYKFKDWTKTETKGKKVTAKMKADRANQVAEILGDASRWHSHGRGISIRELRSEEIKLKINDFGKDQKKNGLIRTYYGLFIDYMQKMNWNGAIHTRHRGLRRLS